MSKSNKKVLVNGCGLTFGSQAIKSWPKILTAVGVDIVNLSAPAISNQWIVDRTSEYLITHDDVRTAIVQLTSLNKLDVEVIDDRREELVELDSLRNFVWQGVWPSSASSEHPSKQLYYKYLYSPTLLTKELATKLALLNFWCQKNNVNLLIYQGYDIPWNPDDLKLIQDIIQNFDQSWEVEYKQSYHYKNHDFTNHNTVPCRSWFVDKAGQIAKKLNFEVEHKIQKIQSAYKDSLKLPTNK
jgi:hypothetical protein